MTNTQAILETLEIELRSKLKDDFGCIHIGFNDHHSPNYVTAQQWHDEFNFYTGKDGDIISWVSDEERIKAIRENNVWTVQWYPRTPISFYCIGASSLATAIEEVIKHDTSRD